jgi:hypothetical protein
LECILDLAGKTVEQSEDQASFTITNLGNMFAPCLANIWTYKEALDISGYESVTNIRMLMFFFENPQEFYLSSPDVKPGSFVKCRRREKQTKIQAQPATEDEITQAQPLAETETTQAQIETEA